MMRATNDNRPREGIRTATGISITLAKWALTLGLLGTLLFAHGCHGDEDHELFTRISELCARKVW
jgi:hypothetical protein